MNLRQFPFIFGRTASAPLSFLDQLIWEERDQHLEKISYTFQEAETTKKLLIACLFELIDNNKGHEAYFSLINLKRDVFNDRPVLKESFLLDQFPALHTPIIQYLKALRARNDVIEDFKIAFEKSLESSTKVIEQLSSSYFLRNGLLFSSETLFRSLDRAPVDRKSSTKKDRRRTISILKYLTRSICKTSPFSSFNQIGGYQLSENFFSPIIEGFKSSNFQVSGLLFYYLKTILLEEPNFRNTLNVQVNPNFWKEDGETGVVHFFVNKNNNEAFKKITDSDLLKDIVKRASEATPYHALVNAMQKDYMEDVEPVRKLVDHLIEEGFLLLIYPVSNTDLQWIALLKTYLAQKHLTGEIHISVKFLLGTILQTIDQLEANNEVEQRWKLIEKCSICCQDFFQNKASDFSTKVKMQDLFYEDTLKAPPKEIPLEPIVEAGVLIQSALAQLDKLSVKKLFRTHLMKQSGLKEGGMMPLLNFYSRVYLRNRELIMTELDMEAMNTCLNRIYSYLEGCGNEIKTLDLGEFFEKSASTALNKPLGVYLQWDDQEYKKFVINSVSSGYGANISRFLNFLPPKYAANVRQFNKNVLSTSLIAEVKDASIHNTNTFPQLADHLISLQQDQALRGFNEVLLKDVFVKVCRNDLMLTNEDGVEIKALNFSLEGQNRRSKFVQFFDIFSADLSAHVHIIDSINSQFKKKTEKTDIVMVPSISFGDNLIFQRRKWLIKTDLLVNKINSTNLYQSYLNIIGFLGEAHIPEEVFIKIRKKDSLNGEDDNYKPQYINFKSPLFIQLLTSLLRNADPVIEFSEMYPNSDQVRHGDGYVKEFILNLV